MYVNLVTEVMRRGGPACTLTLEGQKPYFSYTLLTQVGGAKPCKIFHFGAMSSTVKFLTPYPLL